MEALIERSGTGGLLAKNDQSVEVSTENALQRGSFRSDRSAAALAVSDIRREGETAAPAAAVKSKHTYDIPKNDIRREQIENSVTFGSELVARQVVAAIKAHLVTTAGPVGDALRQRDILSAHEANGALEEKASRKKKYTTKGWSICILSNQIRMPHILGELWKTVRNTIASFMAVDTDSSSESSMAQSRGSRSE